jgi:hypothetical protein
MAPRKPGPWERHPRPFRVSLLFIMIHFSFNHPFLFQSEAAESRSGPKVAMRHSSVMITGGSGFGRGLADAGLDRYVFIPCLIFSYRFRSAPKYVSEPSSHSTSAQSRPCMTCTISGDICRYASFRSLSDILPSNPNLYR